MKHVPAVREGVYISKIMPKSEGDLRKEQPASSTPGIRHPGAKSQGMKQLMAGGGVVLIGTTLVPMLSTLF